MGRPIRQAIRRQHTGSFPGEQIQQLAQDVARQAGVHPTAGARLIDAEKGASVGSGLAFTIATARSIEHGLGRKARGFLEVYGVDLASAAHVGLFATAHPTGVTSATHVTVTPTASGHCLLLVF